ncbi:MAG: DUF4168 domain-containing protein [Bacteroidota bacterium]
MKVLNYLGVIFLLMAIILGCNQGNNKKQKISNEYNKNTQEEQRQMPNQSEQDLAPLQQSEEVNKVSDKELKEFAVAAQKVQIINQEVRQKINNTLKEKGLDVQRFNEIQQTQQNPQQDVDATNEEMVKYKSASMELEKIEGQAHQKIQKKIKESGLTMSRYENIARLLQNNPDLKEKFQMIQQQAN